VSKRNIALGRWGEKIAHDYLVGRGYKVIERNFRTEFGEIDLITERDGVTVFVEVKTRSGEQYGNPEEAITPEKTLHMVESAQAFIQNSSGLIKEWRIDVIAIRRGSSEQSPEITHFENAVQG
jgi:putative endonuclease